MKESLGSLLDRLEEGTGRARQSQIIVDKAAVKLEKQFKGTSISGIAMRDGNEAQLMVRDKKVSPAKFEKAAQAITGWKWEITNNAFSPDAIVFAAKVV